MLKNRSLRSKVQGMFLGGFIGDAWGMPVEAKSAEEIRKLYPAGIKGYYPPEFHKWFKPDEMPAGATTDDTQLTMATVRGLIDGCGFDMDFIAAAHVDAMKSMIGGWGKSTLEAVERIQNGVSWQDSGKTTHKNRGLGNGIVMKVAALSAFFASPDSDRKDTNINKCVVEFGAMTHYNQVAVVAGLIHFWTLYSLLFTEVEDFCEYNFLDVISFVHEADDRETTADDPDLAYSISQLEEGEESVYDVINKLWDQRDHFNEWSDQDIINLFGSKPFNAAYSTALEYAFFYRNPYSIDTVQQVIEAGGDTDTNAKIVLEMIGALHGVEFFEKPENKWTIDGLQNCTQLMATVNEFCNTFGIE